MASAALREFEVLAMYEAMDAKRAANGLSWSGVARAIWDQSAVLNVQRKDHPISPATLTGIARRGDCTCQHALFILRWVGRPPESFLSAPDIDDARFALPPARDDQRLRWNLAAVFEALNARRQERDMTWEELARELRCTENQLTGIRTARFAIGMKLMMRIVQWLDQPTAAFIYAARW